MNANFQSRGGTGTIIRGLPRPSKRSRPGNANTLFEPHGHAVAARNIQVLGIHLRSTSISSSSKRKKSEAVDEARQAAHIRITTLCVDDGWPDDSPVDIALFAFCLDACFRRWVIVGRHPGFTIQLWDSDQTASCLVKPNFRIKVDGGDS